MSYKKVTQPLIIILAVFTLLISWPTFALQETAPLSSSARFPLYVGVLLGYGNTTWRELIARDQTTQLAAPYTVDEGGLAWGFVLGYNLNAIFAFEAGFVAIPRAKIGFIDQNTLYFPIVSFNSYTNVYSLVGKFIVPISNTRISGFADAGLAVITRRDIIANIARTNATFGIGLLCDITHHIMAQLGFQFYIGYGRSEMTPVDDYVPFVYTVHLILAYRFAV